MKYFLNIVIRVMIISVFSSSAMAAPKADLWAYWNVSNQANTQSIDHSAWQGILDRNLSVQGDNHLFGYGSISDQDKKSLQQYIQQLTQLDPRQYNKKQQFAYWVNLYNALTVQVVLDNYPTKSITKIGGLFSFGPWGQDIATINGKTITLNDIEHRILRPIWRDPRIHYAVNCASLGCPNLATQAFTAQNTEALLAQAEREFILSDKGMKITNGKLQLSSIYDWFVVDFGGQSAMLDYLAKFKPEIKRIITKPNFSQPSYEYDWRLNGS
ncbi:DUF547 domain-containing protein [Vibrio sp. S11_S32]|nr:DUF547 domain-containing protein [Vibrio sp. S11_S32]